MIALTKKREGAVWRVYSNGAKTALVIEKGLPAKFGRSQTYDVVDDHNDAYLFEAKGVAIAMSTLERIASALETKDDGAAS